MSETEGRRLPRMSGRDPHQANRAATPLELLFDLTFVIAYGVAASECTHALTAGRLASGLAGFVFATFAVTWAWINFSWFASAYDTDDWVYRLTAMLQMVGVLILALGVPAVYTSIAAGRHVDNRVMVAGYVVMRIAMVAQWLRAARQDPYHRRACLVYATAITIAQVGWIGLIVVDTSVRATLVLAAVMIAVELAGPWVAEKRIGGVPWHAHHMAERYGLLAIIALGEGVVGAVASVSAVVAGHGWTVDAVLLAAAGIGLTFGMWWVYFTVPFADLLHDHRERSFSFGYLHIVLFGAIVGTGTGLHVAASYLEHHSVLTSVATVLTVVVPVGVYSVAVAVIYALLERKRDARHTVELGLTVLVLAAAVWLAAVGAPMPVCLLVVAAAPALIVLDNERAG